MKKIYFLTVIFIFWLMGTAFAASPNASIISPANGSSFYTGNTVTLIGTATDTEDGTLSGDSLSWTSSINGALGNGSSLAASTLKAGTHTITLVATDSSGAIDSASVTITISNPPPVVAITNPSDGASFTVNDTISFLGSASDTQDGALTGSSLVWSSDIDGQIGTGTSFSTKTLKAGTHKITLTATDSDGASTTQTITINVVNTKPTATILLPADSSSFTSGATINFQGRGDDPEDGAILDSTLTWVSSLNGSLGTGPSITTDKLLPGTHTITLTATDSNGLLSDPTTISITITNSGPTPVITSPVDNSVFQDGASITFAGTATDPEDGNLSGASLVWSSNIDGTLGTGTEVKTSTLSSGKHTITLTATDKDGVTGSTSITITAGNKLPVPIITTPENNKIYLEGQTVDFYGTATDAEDGNLSGASLVWTSSRDGQIGTGSTFSSSTLSTGEHIITLTATDSYNAKGSASITIRYGNTKPTVTIYTPENNAEYELGQDVVFHGGATDVEDGDISGSSLVWTSDNSGLVTTVGTGTSFSVNTLTSGTHKITLTATDSGNASSSSTVSIKIKEMYPSKTSLTMVAGETAQFSIIGGLGEFSVASRRSDIASAEIQGQTVTVMAKAEGDTTITVTDKVNNKIDIPVTVTGDTNTKPVPSVFLEQDGYEKTLVSEGEIAYLNGKNSSDSDGSIVSYNWAQVSGPLNIYLDDENSSYTFFTAPPVTGNEKFIFRLTVTDDKGASSSANVEFIVADKETSAFDDKGDDIIPVSTGNSVTPLGVKYVSGLTKAVAKVPESDSRNKPASIPYNLVDLEKKLSGNETAASFIIYLPSSAPSNSSWVQENSATGWQNLSSTDNPLTEGAYFNSSRDQAVINIQDNGAYDLNPNKNVVRTVSGLGLSDSESSSGGSSSGGSCFIKTLF